MTDAMAHANPLNDMLLRTGVDETRSVDLKAAFGDSSMTFTLKNSDGDVVDAEILDGVLTLRAGEHGFSDLVVTGTDALGNTVTDNVRVHVAGENAFTVAVLPDTQNYTSNPALNHIFGDMTNWLVDNAESRNIQFVVGVGDITDNNNAAQWKIAEEALRRLDGKISYSMLPGNHDQASGGSAANHSTDYLDTIFSPDKQAATNPDTFGGVYDREPTRSANTYHTFQAPDGTKWLVLSMEFAPRDDVLRWAGDVIEGHLDHRVIIASHTLTTYAGRSDAFAGQIGAAPVQGYGVGNSAEGANDGEAVYRQLTSRYPNVVITLSGHVLGDSAETNITYSQHGNAVADIMADYQNGSTTELISRGGEGAIRLLVIDPDAGTISMDTYITERDEYLTGYRGKEELDRDGLTGPYRGHQETIGGLDLKAPELRAQADAGADQFVRTVGGTASVELDGTGTLNRGLAASYEWRDADGRVLSTEAVAKVDLAAGKHTLTLVVTDHDGRVTQDEMLLVVSGPGTLLTDNFNDGDARGWGPVPVPSFSEALEFGSTQELGLPALPGGGGGVMGFPATAPTLEGFLIRPDFGTAAGQTIRSYTLVLDMLVKAEHAGKWFALLQTDPAQSSSNDADLLINKSAGLGISGSYTGSFTYDAWHRVALTVTETNGGNATLAKYIDGVLVGTQSMPASRYAIDPVKGFLVFSDNAPNGTDLQTQPGFVSSILFADRAMGRAEIEALGGAKAQGILTAPPSSGHALQFDFGADAPFAPSLGNGAFTVVEPQSILDHTEFGTTDELGSAPMPGGVDEIMDIPATPADQGYLIKPGFGPADGGPIKSYTFIVDVFAPAAKGHWLALLQTDPTNVSDADFLVNMSGGIGINGSYTGTFKTDQWQRVALTVTDKGDGTVTLSKYIEGQLVGTQSMDASRYAIDPAKGFFIFTDEGHYQWNFETAPAQVNSVFFSDRVLTTAEIGAIGGARAGGIVAPSAVDSAHAVQFDFTGGSLAPSYGAGSLELWDRSTSGTYLDGWSVKGSVNAPGAQPGEGALHDRSDAVGKVLLWQGQGAEAWRDYRYDVTLTSTDNDEIGVAFYYQDQGNHYRFTMNTQTMQRELVRVQGGVETVLAEVRAGYRFNDALDLSVVVSEGRIDVLLDDRSVFGGPVLDSSPLSGGTVGVLSSGQKSSIFDNVVVNKLALTAHGEAAMRVFAGAGAETAQVVVSAAHSFGPADIIAYRWLVDGQVVGTGRDAVLDLAIGTESVTSEVTDAGGRTSSDLVALDIVGDGETLMREGFGSGSLGSSWRILDEGTLEGPSDWRVQDGRLYQNSNIYSEQLVANGPSNPDNWQKGWSPLGDGTFVLRKGTTALYQPEDGKAAAWRDYSVEARFHTPDDDGVGLVFYYQDPGNHYKMELDAQRGVWTLVRLVNGIEEVLGQAWGGYAVGKESHLRVDVLDHRITAYLDGEAIFPLPIEDRALSGGTFGLYSWGSKGVSFDDVAVVSLLNDAPSIAGDLRLEVVEGGVAVLTMADLAAVDPDDGAEELSFTVGAATHGEVLVEGVAASSFTQAQLAAGLVSFRHDGSETTAAGFSVILADGGEDGAGPAQADVVVAVTPVNDAPVVSAPGQVILEENRAEVATILASDGEGDAITFSLGGTDGALFAIGEDGHLRFKAAPDYERPTDADGDNLYDLVVRASDGVDVTEHAMMVAVQDVEEGGRGFEVIGVNDWYNPSWGGGFNATFRYTVQEADLVGGEVKAWAIMPNYEGAGRVTSAWASGFNGSVTVGPDADGDYAISTLGQAYKPTLRAGDVLTFTLQVQDAGFDAEDFAFAFDDLDRAPGTPTPSAMRVEAQRTNDWGSGINQNVTLHNAGAGTVEGWQVELDVASGVKVDTTSVWGATASRDGEGDIVFTSLDWNATVSGGGTASFGFNASYSGSNGLQLSSSDFHLLG
ncbi:cadherin-like domain-containing protein [Pararoseomonas sp. SCSIO 73927]|uniref:cellulose binding domain-containing protein n=1 Tax=Pararoseomonas sp. SCSIO 73927 TaxID=3114537 RepID=UPI0030D60DF5